MVIAAPVRIGAAATSAAARVRPRAPTTGIDSVRWRRALTCAEILEGPRDEDVSTTSAEGPARDRSYGHDDRLPRKSQR